MSAKGEVSRSCIGRVEGVRVDASLSLETLKQHDAHPIRAPRGNDDSGTEGTQSINTISFASSTIGTNRSSVATAGSKEISLGGSAGTAGSTGDSSSESDGEERNISEARSSNHVKHDDVPTKAQLRDSRRRDLLVMSPRTVSPTVRRLQQQFAHQHRRQTFHQPGCAVHEVLAPPLGDEGPEYKDQCRVASPRVTRRSLPADWQGFVGEQQYSDLPAFKDQCNAVAAAAALSERSLDLQSAQSCDDGDRRSAEQPSDPVQAVLVQDKSAVWGDATPLDEHEKEVARKWRLRLVLAACVFAALAVGLAVPLTLKSGSSSSENSGDYDSEAKAAPATGDLSQYNCSLPGLETLTPGSHAGVQANYLSFNTQRSSPNFVVRAAEFEACTGGTLIFSEAADIFEDPLRDLGTTSSRGSEVYDGYFMAYSHFPELSQLGLVETLNERIRRDNMRLKWEDVQPKVRTMGEYRKDGVTNIDFLMYDGDFFVPGKYGNVICGRCSGLHRDHGWQRRVRHTLIVTAFPSLSRIIQSFASIFSRSTAYLYQTHGKKPWKSPSSSMVWI